MKKSYIIAAVCLVLCFIFAGCDMRMDRAVKDIGDAAGNAVKDVGDIANDATNYHYDTNANNTGLKSTNAGTYSSMNGNSYDMGRSIIENIGNTSDRPGTSNGDGTTTSISSSDTTRSKIVDYYKIGKAYSRISNALYGSYNGRVAGVNDTEYYSPGAMAGGLLVPRGY